MMIVKKGGSYFRTILIICGGKMEKIRHLHDGSLTNIFFTLDLVLLLTHLQQFLLDQRRGKNSPTRYHTKLVLLLYYLP